MVTHRQIEECQVFSNNYLPSNSHAITVVGHRSALLDLEISLEGGNDLLGQETAFDEILSP